jgi:hypothetical protein
MLTESEITALRLGTFELECLRMELVHGAPGSPARYTGPGRIFRGPDEQLRFTLYVPGAEPRFMPDFPIGVRIPAEAYWHLTATDYMGRPWRCPRMLVDLSWSQPGGGSVISDALPYLQGEEDNSDEDEKGGSFTGYIFRDLQLPANRRTRTRMERDTEGSESGSWDAAVVQVGGVKILFRQQLEQLRVSARDPEATLHPHFAERLRETIQFVAGYPVSWVATSESGKQKRTTYVRGRPSPRLMPRIQRPVPRYVAHSEIPTWRLFEAYFAYVCKDTMAEVHRISAEWSEVLRSSVASVETEALVCAIAVESLCRYLLEERPELGAAAAAPRSGWSELVDAFLEREGADDRLRRRVRGFFGKMASTDHTDVLLELQRKSAVEGRLVEEWSRWRGIMAHGDREAQAESEELSRGANAFVTLLYQLYFHMIGYAGLYTDFSQSPWRGASYPPGSTLATHPGG